MPCLKLEKSEGDAQFWVECLLNIPSRLLAEKHRGGKAAVVRARLVPFKKANTQKLSLFFFFFLINLFFKNFWLCWVFVAVRGLSL